MKKIINDQVLYDSEKRVLSAQGRKNGPVSANRKVT
jgi:hypothetical protein